MSIKDITFILCAHFFLIILLYFLLTKALLLSYNHIKLNSENILKCKDKWNGNEDNIIIYSVFRSNYQVKQNL